MWGKGRVLAASFESFWEDFIILKQCDSAGRPCRSDHSFCFYLSCLGLNFICLCISLKFSFDLIIDLIILLIIESLNT